jgi:2-polyprenyl-6-methoxyphenol hydroxylase-like FAD-dependent oxidoreductase
MRRTITIAGGGLAGLTLGLLLRREKIPVEIWDAASYPRPRVCGEFISGQGLAILEQLELPEFPAPLGEFSRSVRFFTGHRASAVLDLPQAALSVDRSRLDFLLAREFQKRGGVLRENCRWTESFAQEGLVRATGRRLRKEDPGQLLGLKIHVRNLPLSADLELHFSADGYVGLSRQRDGLVNVCGLFRAGMPLAEARANCGKVFARVVTGPSGERLKSAAPECFAAVAGVSLKRESTRGTNECRIGDSICMIPPLTGNGMSLAIESAACAAPVLAAFSRGQLAWGGARDQVAAICDRHFVRRLTVAAFLQWIAFQSAGRAALMTLLRVSPRALNGWFHLTR